MENSLEKQIDSIMSAGNAGVIIADKNGLVLGSAGTLKEPTDIKKYNEPDSAAVAAQLLHLATQLDPSSGKATPEIHLVGDNNRISMHKGNHITVTHTNS